MSPFSQRMVGLAPIFLTCTLPSCSGLVPTLDVAESLELLSRMHGSVVVTQRDRRLRVISFPSGRIDAFETEGVAIAASGLDESAQVVYVRQTVPWIFSDGQFELVLKSLANGEERVLGELGHGVPDRPELFVVGLAAGRAMCSFKSRTPRVIELETGRELDLPWWERRHAALRWSGDGRSVICRDILAHWDEPGWQPDRLVSIDLATGSATLVADAWPFAFDGDGNLARSVAASDSWFRGIAPADADLPGCIQLPCTFIGDSLAIYEGLALPEAHPKDFSFGTYSIEHSIRLADTATHATLTLVPRFHVGTIAYSRRSLPPDAILSRGR